MGRHAGSPHPPPNPFAGFISDRRAELGLSLDGLAERAGVHRNTVWRWTSIVAPPAVTGPVVEALAGALETPPEVVLERLGLLRPATLHHLESSGFLAAEQGVSGAPG